MIRLLLAQMLPLPLTLRSAWRAAMVAMPAVAIPTVSYTGSSTKAATATVATVPSLHRSCFLGASSEGQVLGARWRARLQAIA